LCSNTNHLIHYIIKCEKTGHQTVTTFKPAHISIQFFPIYKKNTDELYIFHECTCSIFDGTTLELKREKIMETIIAFATMDENGFFTIVRESGNNITNFSLFENNLETVRMNICVSNHINSMARHSSGYYLVIHDNRTIIYLYRPDFTLAHELKIPYTIENLVTERLTDRILAQRIENKCILWAEIKIEPLLYNHEEFLSEHVKSPEDIWLEESLINDQTNPTVL
jgi:hypothetical protein